jgi:hypothetical protein
LTSRVAIVASPAAAGLAGLDGRFDWGEAATFDPGDGAALEAFAPDLAVWLDGDPPEATGAVRWSSARAEGGAAIAPEGDGLWGRRAMPVRDDVFELPPAPESAGVLLVGHDGARRASAVDELSNRGLSAAGAAELTVELLESSAAVALLGDEDGEAVPAAAPAVLAAGRILIAPRRRLSFGLQAGTDHLAAGEDHDVLQYADAVLTFPASFEPLRVFGRVSAERHRASVVYGRLAGELATRPAAA